MADPRNELADIVVPVAPAVAAAGSGLWPWILAACLAGLACAALAAWLWHRRRAARALRAIAAEAERRQGELPALAARLDAWARARYRLARLEPSRCPPGHDAGAWTAWVDALTQLRFAAPPPDGWEALAALCQAARTWSPHA